MAAVKLPREELSVNMALDSCVRVNRMAELASKSRPRLLLALLRRDNYGKAVHQPLTCLSYCDHNPVSAPTTCNRNSAFLMLVNVVCIVSHMAGGSVNGPQV